MAIKKIKLPDNTTEDINDPRLPAVTATDNGNLLGVDGGIWSKVNKPSYNLDDVADGSTRKLANYLPLTGGTLSNSTRDFLKINSTNANGPYVHFQISGTTKGYIGYYVARDVDTLWLGASTNRLFLDTTAASLRVGTDSTNYTVYHSGNSNKPDVPWSASELNVYDRINFATGGTMPSEYPSAIRANSSAFTIAANPTLPIHIGWRNVSVPAIYATTSGNVGMGTASPTQRLHVSGNILATGSITPGSDSRIKDNQKEISSEKALFVIENLKPKTWIWNEKSNENLNGKSAAGLVAQEVKEILPDAVTISENGDIKDFHSLNYNTIQGYEIAAIKGLIEEVKSLKAEITELKKQIK